MKKYISRFEDMMAAVAFAEAGEHGRAREFMNIRKKPRKSGRVSRRPRKQSRIQ